MRKEKKKKRRGKSLGKRKVKIKCSPANLDLSAL